MHVVISSFSYICIHIKKDGWKPAQLMIRTRLELIPARKLLSYSGYFGLVTFFGTDSHMYVNVEDEVCSFYSRPFADCKERQEKSCNTSCASFIINKEMHDLGERLAKLESDEERRVYHWSKNYCSFQPYSKREFSVIDQYSEYIQIPSSEICRKTTKESHSTNFDANVIEIEDNEMKDDAGNTKTKKTKKSSDGDTIVNAIETSETKPTKGVPFPQLCPKIQRGLDLQWIASNLDTLSTDRSFEALESMTTHSDLPVSTMMAKLNEERREYMTR